MQLDNARITMTHNIKKKIYNLNLFTLVILIGFLMHWQKNIRQKSKTINTIAYDMSPIHTNNSINQQIILKK